MTDARRDLGAHNLAAYELCLGAGWHAGLAVAPDGTSWPWLLSPADHAEGALVRWPEHELTGPLPPHVAARVRRAVLRCGRPTVDGTPCRTPVAQPGPCWHHDHDQHQEDPRESR